MKDFLLTNAVSDGDGAVVEWSGGVLYFDLNGVIDGATVTVYVDVGGGYNTNLTKLAMTELGLYEATNLPAGATIKSTVSDVGVSTDLTLIVMG